MNGKLGHYHTVALVERLVAVLHRQAGQLHRISPKLQIGVPRIIVLVQACQRIALTSRQFLRIERNARIVAGRQREKEEYYIQDRRGADTDPDSVSYQ